MGDALERRREAECDLQELEDAAKVTETRPTGCPVF